MGIHSSNRPARLCQSSPARLATGFRIPINDRYLRAGLDKKGSRGHTGGPSSYYQNINGKPPLHGSNHCLVNRKRLWLTMISRPTKQEQLRSDLATLIQSHRNTCIWFWRTGIAALAAAFLWILIYLLAPDNMGVTESLAIIIGAILMWILFLWAFFLMRKLNRLTDQVKDLEDQLLALLATNNRDQPT
jgi:hypothetical protein